MLNASDGNPRGNLFNQTLFCGEGAALMVYDGTIWVAITLEHLELLRAADGSQGVKPFPVGFNRPRSASTGATSG